jgi:outer membrane protein TolC
MRTILLSVVLMVSFGTSMAEKLTLDECHDRARANYPLIQQFGLIEQTTQYNINNANSGYLPQVSLSGKATYQSDVTKIPSSFTSIFPVVGQLAVKNGIQLPSGISSSMPELSKDQYQIALEVDQTLWDGGAIAAQKKALKTTNEVDKQNVEVNLYALNQRVDQLYFGILLLEEQLKQNAILQIELKTNYERIDAYLTNGVANQSDLDAIKVEQLNAIQSEAELRSTLQAYRVMLSAFTRSSITENTELLKPETRLSGEVDLSCKRPELRLFDLQNQMFESQKSAIYSSNLPKIGLFVQGGYGRPAFNMFTNAFDPFYIGGLRVSWNFSGFYSQSNNLKKILLNQKQVDVQRETFLFNTDLQTKQQRGEITKLISIVSKDDEIIKLRENIKKSSEVKQDNGTISVNDLIRDINAENSAKQVKSLHEIQLLLAVYQLKYNLNN